MCGNYYQIHSPCGHSGIVGLNKCKGFGTTCLGPNPSKGMDITLPPVDTPCEGCHAAAHQPNPEARLDENDPYRKEARERVAAREQREKAFRAEQEEKEKEKAKEEEEKEKAKEKGKAKKKGKAQERVAAREQREKAYREQQEQERKAKEEEEQAEVKRQQEKGKRKAPANGANLTVIPARKKSLTGKTLREKTLIRNQEKKEEGMRGKNKEEDDDDDASDI